LGNEDSLLTRILAAETFHIVINEDNAIESRGSSLVSLHPVAASSLVPEQLLKCLRPVGMAITFDELRRSAGKYLILDYIPMGLKLRGQFVVDGNGRRGVFLGAPWFQKASEFAAYGLPAWSCYLVGFLKVASAFALLAGLLYPVLILPAASVVAALMVGAIAMHVKVADPFKKSLPALSMLTLSLLMVLGRWCA
jgi:hypothetical protein